MVSHRNLKPARLPISPRPHIRRLVRRVVCPSGGKLCLDDALARSPVENVHLSAARDGFNGFSVCHFQRCVVLQPPSANFIIQYDFVKVKHSLVIMRRNFSFQDAEARIHPIFPLDDGIGIHLLKPADGARRQAADELPRRVRLQKQR